MKAWKEKYSRFKNTPDVFCWVFIFARFQRFPPVFPFYTAMLYNATDGLLSQRSCF